MKHTGMALLLPVLLGACGGLRQVRVEEVRGVQLGPFSGSTLGVALEARVRNPSCRRVQLTRLELNVLRGSAPFAVVSTTEKVSIPRRSNDFTPVPLEVRLRNVLGAVLALQQKGFAVGDLVVEGELWVSAFPLSKRIAVERQSVREFTAQFGDVLTPLLDLRGR